MFRFSNSLYLDVNERLQEEKISNINYDYDDFDYDNDDNESIEDLDKELEEIMIKDATRLGKIRLICLSKVDFRANCVKKLKPFTKVINLSELSSPIKYDLQLKQTSRGEYYPL